MGHAAGGTVGRVHGAPQPVVPSANPRRVCHADPVHRRLRNSAFVRGLRSGTPWTHQPFVDGLVNVVNFLAFLELYAAADTRADFNDSGGIDVADFLVFLAAFA